MEMVTTTVVLYFTVGFQQAAFRTLDARIKVVLSKRRCPAIAGESGRGLLFLIWLICSVLLSSVLLENPRHPPPPQQTRV